MARTAPTETQLDRVLVALDHPTRRAMLRRLRRGPVASARVLHERSGVAYQTTWKDILVLERAGLIARDMREGKTQPLTLQTAPLDALREWMAALYPEPEQPDTVPPMPNADAQVRSLIDAFVDDLSDLVKQSAVDAVREALQRGSALKANGHAIGSLSRSRAPAAKRTPDELEQTTSALLAYVQKNPGQRVEEISAGMRVSTTDLKLPAKKLIAGKKLKTKGVKRATRYFAR